MSQTTSTPRKYQNRGHQQQQQQPHQQQQHHQNNPSFSRSPHPHPHSHSHSSQQHPQLQHGHNHTRNRSQQLRAQAAELQYSGGGAAATTTAVASDYESDTAHYMASHPPPPPAALVGRTNTELNISVLRRYRPSITSILSIAAHAVVYVFTPPAKWDKSNMEGTLFICAQDADGEAAAADGCLFVLNRKGMQNLILDLNTVSDFELATSLLIFRLDHNLGEGPAAAAAASPQIPMENGESVRPKVLGMWIYAEDEQDRRTNAALIHEMWSKARSSSSSAREDRGDTTRRNDDDEDDEASVPSSESPAGDDAGGHRVPATQGLGRQVSLNELFGRNHNGIGGA
ncbi:PH domain-like protein [Daldinia caldariorum]|uniref:PH domain-like protein n=1 Tax=Daldinia caldariorum TaxID=326644 RepID=UPI0020072782|nr:PH domain-like protein [Daldinia caldariorum]KAI1464526.1 PH domain-like protein [Daldinia caldariorum]